MTKIIQLTLRNICRKSEKTSKMKLMKRIEVIIILRVKVLIKMLSLGDFDQ